MSDFKDHYNQSLRLSMLRTLSEAPGYKCNSAVLHSAQNSLGFHVSRDLINTQLDWLQEQSLVDIAIIGTVRVATITERGLDVAAGHSNVTGVDRPSPKA